MKQNKQFDNILNECLDRILQGESVERCLGRYPDQARELEPLLRTALAARIASTVQPRAEFKARARYEFMAALQDQKSAKTHTRPFWAFQWNWGTGWAIALIAVIVMVLGGGSTIAAASNSMPDSALYTVKLATEQVQLAVTPSNVDKAELNAKFANRRADEIEYMAAKGDAQEVRIVAQRLNTNLENMTSLVTKESGEGKKNAGGNLSATSPNVASGPGAIDNNTPQAEPPAAPGALAAPMVAPSQAPSPDTEAPRILAAPSVPAPAQAAPDATVSQGVASGGFAPSEGEAATTPSDTSTLSNADNSRNAGKIGTKSQEKLKKILTDNYQKRQARLKEALKKASPDMKPAIRLAIAQSQAEYEKALKLLEQAANSVK